MTSLPIHPGSAASLPGRAYATLDWLPLEEVARAMGMSARHARRKCDEEWSPAGNARKDSSGSWTVHRRVSSRLIRLEADAATRIHSVIDTLRAAPIEKQTIAAAKAEAVRRFRAWKVSDGVRVDRHWGAFAKILFSETGMKPVGLRQMRALDDRCPPSHDREGMIVALLDNRGRPTDSAAGIGSVGEDAWDLFCTLYLHDKKRTLAKCCRMVRAVAARDHADADGRIAPSWMFPADRRVAQLVERRIDPSTLIMAREGAQTWRAMCKSPIDQNPEAFAAGERWDGDNRTANVFVKVWRSGATSAGYTRIRPTITMLRDWRSRRIMGWHVAPEGTSGTIRSALLSALKTDGVSPPRIVWFDNGKDFTSAALTGLTKKQRRDARSAGADVSDAVAKGLLGRLGIELHLGMPHNPDAKARIERSFGWMAIDFDREFDAWCGARPGERDRAAVKAGSEDIDELLTIEEFSSLVSEWVEYANARTDHSIKDLDDREVGRRLSASEYYARHAQRRVLADPDALRILEHAFDQPRVVRSTGIHVTMAGGRVVRYGAGARGMHPALEPLMHSKQRVLVSFDPGDIRSVSVYTEDFRFLCVAEMNESMGGVRQVSEGKLKEAFTIQREQKRRVTRKLDLAAISLTGPQYAQKLVRDEAVAKTAEAIRRDPSITGEDTPAHTAPLAIVRTPFDGQAAVADRDAVRKAAGAEAHSNARRTVLDVLSSCDEGCQPAPRVDRFATLTDDQAEHRPLSMARLLVMSQDGAS